MCVQNFDKNPSAGRQVNIALSENLRKGRLSPSNRVTPELKQNINFTQKCTCLTPSSSNDKFLEARETHQATMLALILNNTIILLKHLPAYLPHQVMQKS